MPISYACLINRNGTVIFEGSSSQAPGSQKRFVELKFPQFGLYKQSSMDISDELALDYSNEGSATFCAIRTAKTVDLLESKRFFDMFTTLDYIVTEPGYSQEDKERALEKFNAANALQQYQHLGVKLT